MILRLIHPGLFICLILSITACGERPLYGSDQEVDGSWKYSDSLLFKLPAADTNSVHDLILEIEHNKEYPFQNLYVNITTLFPSGKVERNKLNIDLADKAGKWYGECGSKECELEVLMLSQFRFSESGTYSLIMEQYTRTPSLEGIHELSLRLY